MISHFHYLDQVLYKIGVKEKDCHPELSRGEEFRQLALGGGAVSLEEAIFLAGLVWITRPSVIIELGTSHGASALVLAAAVKDIGLDCKISTIDLRKDVDPDAKRFDQELELNINFVTGKNSLAFLSTCVPFKDKQHLVFSDTEIHTRPEEVALIQRKFPKGTVVAIHDTYDFHPHGPMNLQGELYKRDALVDLVELPSPRGLTVLRT